MRALSLPRGHATFHLIESIDIASAILDFARSNKVAHHLLGMPSSGEIRPGSPPHQVKSDAPCPVTLVRAERT